MMPMGKKVKAETLSVYLCIVRYVKPVENCLLLPVGELTLV